MKLSKYTSQFHYVKSSKIFKILVYLLLLIVFSFLFIPSQIADTYGIFALLIIIVLILFYAGYLLSLPKTPIAYGNAWVSVWLGILLTSLWIIIHFKFSMKIIIIIVVIKLLISIFGGVMIFQFFNKKKNRHS